jgi:hypothetical protein
MSTATPLAHDDVHLGFPTKLADSVFAATALTVACWRLLSYAPLLGDAAGDASLVFIRRFPFWAVGALLGVAYAAYWHARERRGAFPSARRHAQAMTLVRYVVAWIVAGYGFDKVLGIQFYLGINWQDRPVSELNGFMLTWYYFYRSRALVLLIAALEIGGAALLLFPRTVLLGAAVLLPVMVNVTLTDFLYDIRGPAPAALYLTLALAYLVWPHRARIAALLFRSAPARSSVGRPASVTVLRVAVLALAFLSAAVWVTPIGKEKEDTLLAGKWRVDRQVVNGTVTAPDAWLRDTTTSAWSNVYIEDGYFTVSGHPDLFDPKRVRWGRYRYDVPRRRVALKFGEQEAGTLTVDTLVRDHMAMHGTLNGDTVALSLTRVKPTKMYRVYWDW